jgi:hypothetical protein
MSEPRRVTVMSPQTEAARNGVAGRTPIAELADQTGVGDLLIRSLIRAQLGLALRVAAAFGVVLGGLPALFAIFPSVGRIDVGGIPLPWLLLGLASFPLLVLLGVVYARQAERNERDFVDLVEQR